jgi:hypothetical protein
MSAMDPDALELIHGAILRGASQLDLVRAAAACARAVTSLVSSGHADALASVEATERWTRNPCEPNANNAVSAESKCLELEAVKVDFQGVGDFTEGWAILSVVMAGLSCTELYEVAAELSVEFAAKAAVGRNIDLVIIVTSELL